MEEDRRFFKILIVKPPGKSRHRREGNIRMDLKEISVNTKNWVDSAHDRD